MASRARVAAAILAAGESRRMGSPKALIAYRGIPALQHVIDRLHASRITSRRIVLGTHADEIRTHIHDDSRNFVVNPVWKLGQLSSLQLAIRSLDENCDGMLVWPVDHFLVPSEVITTLIAAFIQTEKLIVIPTFRGRRGHPVIFAQELYPEILAASLDVGARAVVWAHAKEILEVPTQEEAVVLNLNDPDTLKQALGEASKN